MPVTSRPVMTMPLRRVLAVVTRWARRFGAGRTGNVAILFALTAPLLCVFSGVAIDYGLAFRLQVKLQAATDATVLMLCQTPSTTTQAQLNLQAVGAMGGYMASGSLTSDSVVLTPATSTSPRKIALTNHIRSVTFFSGFTGVVSPQVNATAQCTTPMPKTFEIALVLDTTGSMSEQANGMTKMVAVQKAAVNFVSYFHTNLAFSAQSRMSIVPFAAAVAVNPNDTVANYRTAAWIDTQGASTYHWTNIDSTQLPSGYKSRFDIFNALKAVNAGWDWAGCIETLPYPQNVQDGGPTSDPNTLYVPLLAPDEPGNGNGTQSWAQWNTSSYYVWNSYLSDYTSNANCTNTTGSTTTAANFLAAEKKTCKYVASTTASARSSSNFYGFDLGPNGPNYACASKPLQRLTTNVTQLTDLINSLSPRGSTNIHEGFMWGWRTLSPISVFADGAPYASNPPATTDTNKVIILMTDGMNDWLPNPYNTPNGSIYSSMGYLHNANGSNANGRLPPNHQDPTVSLSNVYDTSANSGRSAIDALTALACSNAKAAGVSVYTIAFSVSSDPIDTTGQNLLKACASSPSQYFLASDSSGVMAAFNQIAKNIGSLRINQ